MVDLLQIADEDWNEARRRAVVVRTLIESSIVRAICTLVPPSNVIRSNPK